MTDITMCTDKDCPYKLQCYRYMATPNEYWQSFFIASPREEKVCHQFLQVVEQITSERSEKDS